MPDRVARIKQNDTSPSLIVTPIDENGDPIPLAAAVAVTFKMKKPGGTIKVDDAAASVNNEEANDRLEYQWQGSDTDEDGEFDGEFTIEWSDGEFTTFPNFTYIRIKIVEELA